MLKHPFTTQHVCKPWGCSIRLLSAVFFPPRMSSEGRWVHSAGALDPPGQGHVRRMQLKRGFLPWGHYGMHSSRQRGGTGPGTLQVSSTGVGITTRLPGFGFLQNLHLTLANNTSWNHEHQAVPSHCCLSTNWGSFLLAVPFVPYYNKSATILCSILGPLIF